MLYGAPLIPTWIVVYDIDVRPVVSPGNLKLLDSCVLLYELYVSYFTSLFIVVYVMPRRLIVVY